MKTTQTSHKLSRPLGPISFPDCSSSIGNNLYRYYLNEKSTTPKGLWAYTHQNLRKAQKHI